MIKDKQREEYLTVDELSARIKFSRQSLYNLIHKGTFILGKHYLKPTPKKVLFKWTEIEIWMGEPSCSKTTTTHEIQERKIGCNNTTLPIQKRTHSSIQI